VEKAAHAPIAPVQSSLLSFRGSNTCPCRPNFISTLFRNILPSCIPANDDCSGHSISLDGCSLLIDTNIPAHRFVLRIPLLRGLVRPTFMNITTSPIQPTFLTSGHLLYTISFRWQIADVLKLGCVIASADEKPALQGASSRQMSKDYCTIYVGNSS
jgi:hypothetical protein